MQTGKIYTIFASILILGTLSHAAQPFDQYRSWPQGDGGGVVYEQDFSTGDLKTFTSFPGYEIGKWGYNGSPGLRATRKQGDKYGFVSVRIPNLKAGKTYKVSMLCRGENLSGGAPHGFCIEFYEKNGKYAGGLYDAQPLSSSL